MYLIFPLFFTVKLEPKPVIEPATTDPLNVIDTTNSNEKQKAVELPKPTPVSK